MNIVPTEAPVYGGGKIVFDVGECEQLSEEKFYLVFCGSQIRHIIPATAIRKQKKLQLEGQIPSHTKEETVEVSAYRSSPRVGGEAVPVGVPALFRYGSDSAHQMAAFLAASVDDPGNLDDLEQICRERFQLTSEVQANLDERLTSAFKALHLPPCWNMMGTSRNGSEPAERLLHFSARLGLSHLSSYFLSLPGSEQAVSALNHEGLLPEHVALKVGFYQLADLLRFYREQGTTCLSALTSTGTDHTSPVVVSTNLNWTNRDLEYDISEVEKLKDNLNCTVSDDCITDKMKEYHITGKDVAEPRDVRSDGEDSSMSNSQPVGRVLEQNLRRLREIHESIQKIRQLNTKQIAEHSQKAGTVRLSNSCPSLHLSSAVPEQQYAYLQSESLLNMRTFHQRRTSLSSNSRSLDSTLFDAINVKIRINDLTPTVSQECILLPPNSPVNEEDKFPYSQPTTTTNGESRNCQVSNIGGTASRRLAKKSGGKKGPVRRQSWSSLGAGATTGSSEEKQAVPRRWSLSSLDSDAEEAFSDATDCFRGDFSPSSSSGVGTCSYGQTPVFDEVAKEKSHTLTGGNCEESPLAKSAKQSLSVPSMPDITAADIKENLEPDKSSGNGNNSNGKNFFATMRINPLQKSLSTPTIVVDEDELHEKAKQEVSNRQSMCIIPPAGISDVKSPISVETDEASKTSLFQHVSLAGVLRESQRHPAAMDSDEEKPFSKRKKRSSIFFKKKPDKHKAKESKKTAHQFVTCQGSSMNCDVCHKPFIKKQGLRCESCLVVVHDSSCKDQVIDCNKFKLQTAQAKPSYLPISKDSVVTSQTVNGTSSVGHNKNASYSQQPVREKSNLSHFHGLQTNSGIPSLSEAATRSSFINLRKMISDERDNDGSCEVPSNITEINSASMESLDEGAVEISDLEDNQVLRLTDDEPETWRSTVDKKILKKLKDKEVKRQEAIYELILTEKHHCLNLQIMQKVYAQGMMKELNMSRESVERLFPYLPELIELHKTFLSRLRERQSENLVVEHIADILEEQFHDQRAEQMKIAYGQFCSQHLEALNLYKEWAKSDRKFQNFIKRCSSKRLCKTKGIPECLLLVTQRITKYNLIIKSLIKAAKDSEEEQQTLTKVLDNLSEIISQVDIQVAEKEKELRLLEIFNRMDPKTAIYYRGKKFKKSDVIANNRKLSREGPLIWRSPRGKTIDVLAVITSDFIFFLQENNQKYTFASLENKPGIVSLQKLLVRKKAGQDSRGMYLISSNPNEPEMIELLCRTSKDQKAWIEAVREAVGQCPAEDEGIPSETDEERKLDAARNSRVKELISLLHEKDLNVAHLCEDKMRLMVDMMEVVGVDAELYENVHYSQLVESECGPETKDFISAAISNASRLANSLYASGTNLSRSFSSAGEHQSENYISPLLPKRAETFGGFDNPSKEPVVPNKVPVLKKKLLHLKEHTEVMSFLPSKAKIDEDFELGESLEIALRGFDSKTRTLSRPSSICGSPDKQHNRKSSTASYVSPQTSLQSCQEISSEILRLTVTPLLISQGKEQLVQIVELAHHLNNVMCTVSHLASTVERLKAQMAQANERISKLTKEKEVRDRRPMYRPEHQLEELRNLQKQLNHDRSVWQQEKAQHEAEMKSQREEIERMQEQLKTEQLDVTQQRELLYRKLDTLQKQGIILSPSHTVLNNYIARDSEGHKEDTQSANLPSETNSSLPSDLTQHRRTISCDVHHDSRDLYGSIGTGSHTAPVVLRQDSKSRPSVCSASLPSTGKVVVPMHLSSSATNLQKRQSVSTQPVKQQLPLKLANTNAANGGTQIPQGPQQVLPLKLALGSLPSNIPSFLSNEETKGSVPKRSHSAASSPSSTLTTPVHVRGGSSPALVTYPPNSNVSMSPNGSKAENTVFHQLKLSADKAKNKKSVRDSNQEIFC